MNNKGFTLLELIIVIAIFTIMSSATLASMAYFLNDSQVYAKTTEMLHSLRKAQSNAVLRLENSKWGIYLDDTSGDSSFTLFRGSSYATRSATFDETYDLPTTIDFENISITGGGDEIVFEKLTGETTDEGSFQISDGNSTSTISINQLGQINVQED